MGYPYFYPNLLFILIWLATKRRLQPYPVLIWLGYLMIFNLSVEVLAWEYSVYTEKSNHWIYNLYTAAQITIIALMYRHSVFERVALKKK